MVWFKKKNTKKDTEAKEPEFNTQIQDVRTAHKTDDTASQGESDPSVTKRIHRKGEEGASGEGIPPTASDTGQQPSRSQITGTVHWAWKKHLNDYYPKYCSWMGLDSPTTDEQRAEKAELDGLLCQINETGSMDAATKLWQKTNQSLLVRGYIKYSSDPEIDDRIKVRLYERIKDVKTEDEANAVSRELLIRYANFYQDKIINYFTDMEHRSVVDLNRSNLIGSESKFGGIFTRLNSRLSASENLLKGLSLEDALKRSKEVDGLFSKWSDSVAWDYSHAIIYNAYKNYQLGSEEREPQPPPEHIVPMQPVPLTSPGRDKEILEYEEIKDKIRIVRTDDGKIDIDEEQTS